MKYYLCKFIPPRADFLATMSADEQKLMKQHGDFLNDRLAQGSIVAHGPVIDEAGGYGVSLYQLSDDEDISAVTEQALHHASFEGAQLKASAFNTIPNAARTSALASRAA